MLLFIVPSTVDVVACDHLPWTSGYSAALLAAIVVTMLATFVSGIFVVSWRRDDVVVKSQPEWLICIICGALVCFRFASAVSIKTWHLLF